MLCHGGPADEREASVGAKTALGFAIEGRVLDSDIDASAVYLAGFQVPAANPITQRDIDEFIRTHKRTRYRFGPNGSLTLIGE
jgi:hypothetical protein